MTIHSPRAPRLQKTAAAIVLAAASCLASCSGLSAQSPAPASPSPQPRPATESQTALQPLVESASSLPARFETADIRKTIESMAGRGKSQFETSKDYETRLVKEASDFVFLSDEPEVKYDADHGRLQVFLNVEAGASYVDSDRDSALVVISHQTVTADVAGANAFGAKVTIKQVKVTTYGLAAKPVPSVIFRENMPSRMGTGYRWIPIEFAADASKARTAIEGHSVRLLFIAKPSADVAQRTKSGTYTWGATIQHPEEKTDTSHGLYVDVGSVRVWVVEMASREVLLKTTLKQLLRMK